MFLSHINNFIVHFLKIFKMFLVSPVAIYNINYYN